MLQQKTQLIKDYQYGKITFSELQDKMERYGENIRTVSAPTTWFFADDDGGWIRANSLAETLREKGYEPTVEAVSRDFDGYLLEEVKVEVQIDNIVSVRGLKTYGLTANDGSVLLARKDHKNLCWEAFNAAALDYSGLTLEKMDELAEDAKCDECHSRHARRWVYLVKKANGSYVTFGTNCGAKLFGLDMSKLWAKQHKASEKINKLHELFGEFVRRSYLHIQSVPQFEEAAKVSHEQAVEAFTKLTADAPLSNTYYSNTLKMLLSDSSRTVWFNDHYNRYELTRWGEAVERSTLKFFKKEEKEIKKPDLVKPEVEEGTRGSFTGTVTKIQFRDNPYSYYGEERCITVTLDSGWKVWFKSQSEAIEEGKKISFNAKVASHKETISFLSRATKVQEIA